MTKDEYNRKMTEEEFQKFWNDFSQRIFQLDDDYTIFKRVKENGAQANRSGFGHIFLRVGCSLFKSIIIELYSIYNDEIGMSIVELLKTIETNIELFSEKNWKKRVGDRHQPPRNSDDPLELIYQTIQYKPIDRNQLNSEINLFKKGNDSISRIRNFRNSIVAHRNKDFVLGKWPVENIPFDDVDILTPQVVDIVNKYNHLYNSTVTGVNSRHLDNRCQELFKKIFN
jgi:hypothetical protein